MAKILENAFRTALLSRQVQYGCWSNTCSNLIVEALATGGWDWLLIDGEHSTLGYSDLADLLRAAAAEDTATVVRVSNNDPVIFKRMMDIGVKNFLVPMVHSAEEAKAAVAATRYPPTGVRGISAVTRANGFGRIPNYFSKIGDNVSVIVQIESGDAVAATEEIASVEGVDCVFIGPSDLAADLGYIGEPGHAVVQTAIQDVANTAARAGCSSGILCGDATSAKLYRDMGLNVVACGVDLVMLVNASDALLSQLRSNEQI